MSSTLKSLPFPSRRNLSLSLAAAVALVLGSQGTQAASLTWDANVNETGVQDGTGIWSTAGTNWWTGTANVSWGTGTVHSVTFGGGLTGTAGTITLGSDLTVGNIAFLPPSTGTATYSVTGSSTLTLSSTTISGTAAATISANLTGTTGLTVTNTAGSTNTNGNAGGVLLTGDNTYSGKTTVSGGGILRIGNVNALGNSTNIEVGNGSTLILATGTGTSVGANKTLTLYGPGPGNNGALRGMNGSDNTWAGNIVLGNDSVRISGASNGSLTISGVISDAASNRGVLFNRIGGTTTKLTAVNTYTGDTTLFNNALGTTSTLKIGVDNAINANSRLTTIATDSNANAVLDLNGYVLTLRGLDTSLTSATSAANIIVRNSSNTPSTLTVGDLTGNNTAVFGGSIQNGGGGMSLTKIGENTQVLAGVNTYNGMTTVRSGTLNVSGSIASSSAIAVQNSGSFLLSGSNLAEAGRIGNATPVTLGTSGASSGDARFTIDNSATSQSSVPFQETVGALTLLSNSILDLGVGGFGTHLSFADSSSSAWTGTLSIYNWSGTAGFGGGTDQLFFGIDQHGLTADQLSRITFYGEGNTLLGGGMLLSNGELVLAPVPEPSTIFCGLAMLGLLGWRERRRFSRKVAVEG